MTENVWLKTTEEKLDSLIGDEAKNQVILDSIAASIRQLQAKNRFRIALLNQLRDELD